MSTKTLLLLRHAKSSWKDAQLDDHDRPLNARGRKGAKLVGRILKDESFEIQTVLCSTSVRTRETAKLVFDEFKTPPEITFRKDLYHASADQIAKILSHLADPIQSVLVIGHNPGFEEVLTQLTGDTVEFPTAALALIDLEIDYWNQFDNQTRGRLVQIWRPKEIDSNGS